MPKTVPESMTAAEDRSLSLWIPGPPMVKRRPLGLGLKADGTPHYVKRDPTGWEDEVAAAWFNAYGRTEWDGPLAVEMDFYVRGVWVKVSQLTDPVFRQGRGDLSNRVKAVEDALDRVAWVDDRQIVLLRAQSLKGREPC